MPSSLSKKLIRKDRSVEKLKDQSTIQFEQEGYQKYINEVPGDTSSREGIHNSLATNMKKSSRGSPQFLISPRQDGSQHDLDTQLGTTNRGNSISAIKQQLQQTHFQIQLPNNLLDNAGIN